MPTGNLHKSLRFCYLIMRFGNNDAINEEYYHKAQATLYSLGYIAIVNPLHLQSVNVEKKQFKKFTSGLMQLCEMAALLEIDNNKMTTEVLLELEMAKLLNLQIINIVESIE